MKLTASRYQELKNFLIVFQEHFPKIQQLIREVPLDQRPLYLLEDLEKKSPLNASKALQMAVNDLVEMADDWSLEKVAQVEVDLKGRGVLSLSEVRHQYSGQYKRIVKRGRIKSEEEYFLLKGVFDGGGIDVNDGEGKELYRILTDYEEAQATPRNR